MSNDVVARAKALEDDPKLNGKWRALVHAEYRRMTRADMAIILTTQREALGAAKDRVKELEDKQSELLAEIARLQQEKDETE